MAAACVSFSAPRSSHFHVPSHSSKTATSLSSHTHTHKKVDMTRLSHVERYWSGQSWEAARQTSHRGQKEASWEVCCHPLTTHSSWDLYRECGQKMAVEVEGRCRDYRMKKRRRVELGLRGAVRRCHLLRWQQPSPYFTLPSSSPPLGSRAPAVTPSPVALDSPPQPVSTPQPIHPKPTRPNAVTVPAHNSDHTRHNNGEPLTSPSVCTLASRPQHHTT